MASPGTAPGRADELASLADAVRAELDSAHAAREAGLVACRLTIRACSKSIRAVHRLQLAEAAAFADDAEAALRDAQAALAPHPAVAYAGFLHDAAKEYAEARITAALVTDSPVPSFTELRVEVPAWLNGLAEAASEIRRHLLDRLRAGDLERAEQLIAAMDDVYGLLITVDYPDAITGGLRRTTDALRAVLERTRGDLTVSAVQARLQAAIESRVPNNSDG